MKIIKKKWYLTNPYMSILNEFLIDFRYSKY
jgi:hypothetical protein